MGSFDVIRDGRGSRFVAVGPEGGEHGHAVVRRRPDRRTFVFVLDASADACRTLLAAVARDVDGPLHTTVEASDAARLADLASAGFVPTRRESEYVLDVATALGRLGDASLPTGYVLANVGDVPPDELRVLDDRLRQDVPGTDGWEWDAAGFHDETYDPGQFDPQLYWIAVHQVDGERVGLVRVWRRPEAFRLGLIAVLPRHRRRGISRGLLGHVLGRLDARGVGEVVTEIDDGNEASRGLLIGLGVRRIGGSVELVRGGAAR